MFVKKYEAETLEQGLKQIRQELGPDALILSTQKRKSGLLGKSTVEITAAFEAKKQPKPKPKQTVDEEVLAKVFPYRKAPSVETRPETPKKRTELKTRYVDIDSENKNTVSQSGSVKRSRTEIEFMRLGISPEVSKELSVKWVCDYPETLNNPHAAELTKSRILASRLKTLPLGELLNRKAWAVIGTAGSGKTTSVVKLAACLRQQNKAPFLSSLDTRKVVSGIEMGQYSRLLRVPFKKATDHPGHGIQLIDTPSIQLDYQENNWALVKQLEGLKAAIILCVEGTLRLPEMNRIVETAQSLFPVEAVLLTKMDLVTQAGFIMDLQRITKLPVFAFSQSQSLKDLIHFPDSSVLSQIILKRGELS